MPHPSHPRRLRLPAFHPVPVRTRADGWTPLRQAEFVGMLAETGSVRAAAAFVGMARETAYRLRRHPEAGEFARAWDLALVIAGVRKPGDDRRAPRPRKVTHAPTWRMIVDGQWQPVLRHGTYAGTVKKADNSALLGHLAQLDRALRAERKHLRRALRSQAETRACVSTGPACGAASPRAAGAAPHPAGKASPPRAFTAREHGTSPVGPCDATPTEIRAC